MQEEGEVYLRANPEVHLPKRADAAAAQGEEEEEIWQGLQRLQMKRNCIIDTIAGNISSKTIIA